MFLNSRHLLSRCALALAIGCFTTGSAFAQNATNRSILSLERNKSDNTVKSISFAESGSPKANEVEVLFSKQLGVDGINNKMVLKNHTVTNSGIAVDRYTQFINGIKVEHGDYTVTIKEGTVRFMNGNIYKTGSVNSGAAVLTEEEAFANAKRFVGADKYMWDFPGANAHLGRVLHKADTSYLPKARMVWMEDLQINEGDRKLHLAYAFDIYAVSPLSRQIVYVDAATGHILFSNSLINHTTTTVPTLYSRTVSTVTSHVGSNYMLWDSTRGNGIYTASMNYDSSFSGVVDFLSASNTWPTTSADTQALDVHWAAGVVYDYWRSAHSRLSFDNADGEIDLYVHYKQGASAGGYNNAFWDGYEMCYGDGTGLAAGGFTPLVSLDVTAHEIGHGVCQNTANLVYSRESGAMNEAFSDCWAANVEHYGDPHESDAVAKQYWKVGEEIKGGSPLRSMDNPLLQSDPATYHGTNWQAATTAEGCATPNSGNDQCGVHTNSGVLNHWYYFLVNGGSGTNDLGTAYSVTGLSWTRAANILYQTELTLASTANYAACRTASIAAAITLYGSCSAEQQAVEDAWHAVGVGAGFVPCVPQIGFTAATLSTTERSTSTSCPATHTITFGMKAVGTPITGGSPVVTLVPAYGSAVSGTDYTYTPASITFTPSDTTTHYVTMTIYDNAVVRDNKFVKFGFTLATGGSTATMSPSADSLRVNIINNDSIPNIGGIEYHTLDTTGGRAYVTSNNSSAFAGASRRDRTQYLLTASDLIAAGVRPGVPISQLAFKITTRNSTAAFLNYTVALANTTTSDLASAYATGTFTTVYSGNFTTYVGWDSVNFSSNFTWDGTSNVAVNVCWGQNTAAFGGNDQMAAVDYTSTSTFYTNYRGTNTGTGTGCGLTWNGAGSSYARPFVRFKQLVPPCPVETVAGSTRTWDVKSSTEVYFYTPTADTNVIVGLNNETANLGCATATVTQAGVGFTASAYSAANRSRKEISVTPTTGTGASYDLTFYMTNTELNSVAPGTLFLLKTTSSTDAGITTANSTQVTPTIIAGTNYVAFRGTFTGFGRYFLTNGPICINPPTTVTPSGPTTFCTGGSVVLTAAAGTAYTYQWRVGGTNIAGATNGTYTATTAGTYDVIINQGTCSTTSATTTVVVNTVSAGTISGPGAVCVGSAISLSPTVSGGTWSSGSTSIATVNSSGVVIGIAAGASVISYSVTNSCGTAVATQAVAVNALTTLPAITGTTTACSGGTTTLGNATTGGVWSSGATSIATVNTTGTVYGVSAGTAVISYTYTNAAGCVSRVTASVTVTAGISATISAGGPITFCSGGNVTLSSSTGTGYTYQWQRGGTNIAGATNASYSATTAGLYNVVITAGACNATSSTITVTVNTAYAAPITGSNAVCTGGGTLALSDTSTGGVWSSSASSVATVNTSGLVYGVTPGTAVISYTVTNACGTSVATKTVTVSTPISVAAITGTTSVCPGLTSTLSNATSSGVWSSTNTSIATISTGGIVTGLTPGTDTIRYSVTNSSGCVSSSMVTFTVRTAPTATITPTSSTTFCTGGHVLLNAPTGSGLTYQWKSGGTNIAGATNSSYNATAAGNITVVVSNTSGCSVTSGVTVVTLISGTIVVPSVTITANPGFILCATAVPDTFTANPVNGGSAPTYQWYVNGTATSTAATMSYTPASGDVVKVRLTSSAACAVPDTASATATVSVSGYVAPLVAITVAPNDTLCAGTIATLSAIPVYGGSAPTYRWTKNGLFAGVGVTYSYMPVNGDVIFCTMRSNYACLSVDSGVSTPIRLTVDTNSAHTVTITASRMTIPSLGTPVTFNATAPHGGSTPTFQWLLNGLTVPGATTSIYTTTVLGLGQVVTCRVVSSDICATPNPAISNSILVTLVKAGIMDQNNSKESFTLVPNPNNGTFTISGTISSIADGKVTIRISDVIGQTIYLAEGQVHNGSINESISLNKELANGMYLVNIITAEGSHVVQMILDK